MSMRECKIEKRLRKKNNSEILIEMISSMFVRKGLPSEIDTRIIEEILITWGCGAYWKNGEKWIFSMCQLAGEPDEYGRGKNAICTTYNGVVKTFENWIENPDIVVCFNSNLLCPDLLIDETASELSEIDTSLHLNVINSRLFPVPIVNTETERYAIETLQKEMVEGKMSSFISNNVLEMIETGNKGVINTLNLNDPKSVEYLQYLAKYREDKLRWFWNLYGQNAMGSSKIAQQNSDEINSYGSLSMIIPHARYHERMREKEALKNKFGWDVTIEFSEPWQNSFAQCQAENNYNNEETEINEGGENNDDNL